MAGPSFNRRVLFQTVGAAAVASALVSHPAGPASAAVGDLSALIERRRMVLAGGTNPAEVPELAAQLQQLEAAVRASLTAMDTSPARTSLWNDISIAGIGQTSAATGNLGLHFNRVFDLALAYATPGTALHGDPQLRTEIVSGLQLLSSRAYKVGQRAVGNWWFWEIGVPRQTVDILTLVYSEVPTELRTALLAAVRYFTPNPNFRGRGTSFNETGANRVDKALACAMRGILDGNTAEIALARDALSDTVGGGRNSLFKHVTSGDGFYADGSFVQHTYLPYVGTYGVVALAGLAEIFAMLGGSTWAVTDPNKSVLLNAIESTYAPFVWDGRIMDTVRGRAVSRQSQPDYVSGFGLISAVLMLAPGCEEPYRSRFLALAKGWIERCADQKLVGHPSQRLAQSLTALDVLQDSSVAAVSAPVYSRMFADQERLVHHRPSWGCTVNISSTRIGRYEWGNNENNLGWYQGDGMSFVYTRSDASQFSSDFWPTVDPYGLPGTTVNNDPRTSGAGGAGTGIPRAFRPFAGGLTVEGRWGVLGMDHQNHNKTLSARKSWFFLDEAVVCLGADITGTGGSAVHTTIENRSFATGAAPQVRTDSRLRTLSPEDPPVSARRSVHIDGHGGYVFIEAEGVTGTPEVSLQRRTGTWQSINSGADTGGSADPVSRDFITITHHHGTDPSQAGYAYMLLPAAAHQYTYAQSANPDVKVLANNQACQMIAVERYDLVLANFFAAGNAGGYQAGGPCTVAARKTPDGLAVSVADPSRTQSTVRLALPADAGTRLLEAGPCVTVVSDSPLTVDVQLQGTRGHEKRFMLGV